MYHPEYVGPRPQVDTPRQAAEHTRIPLVVGQPGRGFILAANRKRQAKADPKGSEFLDDVGGAPSVIFWQPRPLAEMGLIGKLERKEL